MKKATLLFVLLSISFIGTCDSSVGDNGANSLPPQGLYDSCVPSDADCQAHLDKMADAGFKLIINYGIFDYDIAGIMGYADHAASVGMKVIWDMSAPDYRNGTFSREYIRERVNAAQAHSATWGYYIADEPDEREHGLVKALSDYIHDLDPAHPRFLVHYYQIDDPVVLLRPQVDSADVIALDVYALASNRPSEDIGVSVRSGEELAEESGKQWAIVLQSFDAAQYPKELPDGYPGWPDRGRMLQERDLALENSHPVFILWYSYFDILRSPDPAGHWADLVAAAFGPRLRTGVLSIATTPPSDPPPSDQDYQKALDRAYHLVYKAGISGDGISLTWSELEPSPGVFNLDETRSMLNYLMNTRDFDSEVLIEPLNTTTRETPSDLAKVPFDSPQIKTRFRALLDALMPLFNGHVKYLSIGNEVDVYLSEPPDEWAAYQSFYEDAVAYVHSAAPWIKVGVTTTFSGANEDSASEVARLTKLNDILILTTIRSKRISSCAAPMHR
jgi:hypothetical protein